MNTEGQSAVKKRHEKKNVKNNKKVIEMTVK